MFEAYFCRPDSEVNFFCYPKGRMDGKKTGKEEGEIEGEQGMWFFCLFVFNGDARREHNTDKGIRGKK